MAVQFSKHYTISLLLVGILVAWCNCTGYSQGTTAVGLHVGLTASYYNPKVPETKAQTTFFLPHINTEIKRSSSNIFYGSFGLGMAFRRIPFYTFENGNKIGVEAMEYYSFVKTGFQARSNFLTHLPYLSLGVSRYGNGRSFYSSSKVTTTIDTTNFKNYVNFRPYVEFGSTMLNSTYVEDKRNILVTFSIRYYPTNVFKENFIYEFDFNDIRQANYNMVEFILAMGIQQNFHHKD
jgi:hypothetical protein